MSEIFMKTLHAFSKPFFNRPLSSHISNENKLVNSYIYSHEDQGHLNNIQNKEPNIFSNSYVYGNELDSHTHKDVVSPNNKLVNSLLNPLSEEE